MKLHIVGKRMARPDQIATEELVRRAGLALGWDVRLAPEPDYDWPDVLLYTHAWTAPAPPCRPIKAQWWFDLLWTDPARSYHQQERWHPDVLGSMDLVLMKERPFFDAYRAEGINVHYMDQACWPPLYMGPMPEPQEPCDIAFAGKCHERGGRRELIRALGKRFTVHIWSDDPRWRDFPVTLRGPAYDGAYLQAVVDAKVHLNIGWRNDVDGCWSSRVWQVLGAGGFLLSQEVPGLDAILPADQLFRRPDEAGDLSRAWLLAPVMQAAAARLQLLRALDNDTYCHRLLELEALCTAL